MKAAPRVLLARTALAAREHPHAVEQAVDENILSKTCARLKTYAASDVAVEHAVPVRAVQRPRPPHPTTRCS